MKRLLASFLAFVAILLTVYTILQRHMGWSSVGGIKTASPIIAMGATGSLTENTTLVADALDVKNSSGDTIYGIVDGGGNESISTGYRVKTRAGIDVAITAGAKSIELTGDISLAANLNLSAFTGLFSTNGHQITGAFTFTAPPNFVGSPGCFGSTLTVTGLNVSHVDWFTGIPDGTTDNSAGIIAAIAAVPRSTKAFKTGMVIFPKYESNYYSMVDITITTAQGWANPDFVIKGQGTIKFASTKGFVLDSASFISFEDLILVGSGDDGQKLICSHDLSSNINIRRCTFVNVDGSNSRAIYMTSTYLVRIIECLIHSSSTGVGMEFTDGTGNCSKGTRYANVQDLRIDNCRIVTTGVGIQLGNYATNGSNTSHVTGASIVNTEFERPIIGIVMDNVSTVSVSGCYFEGPVGVANKGITIKGTHAYGVHLDSLIFNSNSSNFDPAIEIVSGSTVNGLILDSVRFNNCASTITSTSWGLKTLRLNGCIGLTGTGVPTLTQNTVVEAFGNDGKGVETFYTALTTGDNLQYSASGKWFTNTGASGDITLILPTAVVGAEYHFIVTVAHAMNIDPIVTDQIRGTSGAGKYAAASGAGTIAHFRCVTAGWWEIEYTGTVIFEE